MGVWRRRNGLVGHLARRHVSPLFRIRLCTAHYPRCFHTVRRYRAGCVFASPSVAATSPSVSRFDHLCLLLRTLRSLPVSAACSDRSITAAVSAALLRGQSHRTAFAFPIRPCCTRSPLPPVRSASRPRGRLTQLCLCPSRLRHRRLDYCSPSLPLPSPRPPSFPAISHSHRSRSRRMPLPSKNPKQQKKSRKIRELRKNPRKLDPPPRNETHHDLSSARNRRHPTMLCIAVNGVVCLCFDGVAAHPADIVEQSSTEAAGPAVLYLSTQNNAVRSFVCLPLLCTFDLFSHCVRTCQ